MTTSDGSKPLDVQVGGDHYKSMAIQPMEYSMANKLDACQHTIIKYVTRFRDKGGIQDLEKAKHCIDLLIHFELQAAALSFVDEAQAFIDPADVEIASAIDDSSERMQAIGQNGNGGEHYGAPDWSKAPNWAMWLAQDEDGEWYWFEKHPDIGNSEWWAADDESEIMSAGSGSKSDNWKAVLHSRPAN